MSNQIGIDLYASSQYLDKDYHVYIYRNLQDIPGNIIASNNVILMKYALYVAF